MTLMWMDRCSIEGFGSPKVLIDLYFCLNNVVKVYKKDKKELSCYGTIID